MQASSSSPVDLGKLLLVHYCCWEVCSGAIQLCSRAGGWFVGAFGGFFLLMDGRGMHGAAVQGLGCIHWSAVRSWKVQCRAKGLKAAGEAQVTAWVQRRPFIITQAGSGEVISRSPH